MGGPSSCWLDGQRGEDEAAGGLKVFETNLQEIVSEPGSIHYNCKFFFFFF